MRRPELLRLQAPPVHLRRGARVRDARTARQALVTVEGQQFLPGDPDKRLYPVHFCRDCGHEYHPVRLSRRRMSRKLLRARHRRRRALRTERRRGLDGREDDAATATVFGFVTLHARDADFTFAGREEDYPETWLEYDAAGGPRSRATTARRAAREAIDRRTDGQGRQRQPSLVPPRQVPVLPALRRTHRRRGARPHAPRVALGRGSQLGHDRARRQRSPLDARQRTRASTHHAQAARLHRQPAGRRPAVGALQRLPLVSLIRAGFLGALDAAGDKPACVATELGAAQQRALGFDRPRRSCAREWLLEPTLKGLQPPGGRERASAGALRTASGSISVAAGATRTRTSSSSSSSRSTTCGIDELAVRRGAVRDGAGRPALATPRRARKAVYRSCSITCASWMAIRSHVLDPTVVEQMLAKSHARLGALGVRHRREAPQGALAADRRHRPRNDTSLRDEDLIVRGGSRSALGPRVASRLESEPVGQSAGARARAEVQGLRRRSSMRCSRPPATRARVRGGHAVRRADRLAPQRRVRALQDGHARTVRSAHRNENAFFRDFYANLAATLREPRAPALRLRGARAHRAGRRREARGSREALPLR